MSDKCQICGGPPHQLRPIFWYDQLFLRDVNSWFVQNDVYGQVGPFDSRASAEAWIEGESRRRSEIEALARVIDEWDWERFDCDPSTREAFMLDRITDSLQRAKRVLSYIEGRWGVIC